MTTTSKDNRYTTTFIPETKRFVRVDNETGKTWVWVAAEKPLKPDYTPNHGVSIEEIKSKGHTVRVHHYRFADYSRQKPVRKGGKYKRCVTIVPAIFRKHEDYHLLPNGGFTHIVISTNDNNTICVSSECSEDDLFCYKRGIQTALEKLNSHELAHIMK